MSNPVVHTVRCTYPQCQATNGCVGACSKGQAEKQEPVAWFIQYEYRHEFLWREPTDYEKNAALEIKPLYTAPREWVGLEEEEILKCFDSVALGQVEGDCVIDKHVNIFNAIRAIEAKLREKNGATAPVSE